MVTPKVVDNLSFSILIIAARHHERIVAARYSERIVAARHPERVFYARRIS